MEVRCKCIVYNYKNIKLNLRKFRGIQKYRFEDYSLRNLSLRWAK